MTSPKPNFTTIVEKQGNLNRDQKQALEKLLLEYKDLFDGSIGDWDTSPISLKLKPGAIPYHGKPYPVTVKNKEKFKKKLSALKN